MKESLRFYTTKKMGLDWGQKCFSEEGMAHMKDKEETSRWRMERKVSIPSLFKAIPQCTAQKGRPINFC